MIKIKSPEEVEIMAQGGKILSQILNKLKEAVRPGITTKELDKLAHELVLSYKKEGDVRPAFLGYDGFPAVLCVSINDEVVHGVPSDRIIKEGDLISLDMGLIFNSFYLDSALTVPALADGDYSKWAKQNGRLDKLLKITSEALNAGINKAKAGNYLGEIGSTIQKIVESAGFNVIKDLVGHGIGRALHEEPQILNFGDASSGPILKEGMVLAIEPMVAAGSAVVTRGTDSFVYKTKDGSLAAHFEHTVAVTKAEPLVLTK